MTTRTAARVTGTAIAWALVAALLAVSAHAQMAPSREEIQAYTDLFAAAARGDAKQITALIAAGAKPPTPGARGRVGPPRRRHERAGDRRRRSQRAGERSLRHRHHRGGGRRPGDASCGARAGWQR